MMDARTRKRLIADGWAIGSEETFLGLRADETALIDCRSAVRELVRFARARSRMSQTELAERLGSSQSRVAKLEGPASKVSLDLMIRAAVVAGATTAEIGRAILRNAAVREKERRELGVTRSSLRRSSARSRSTR